MPGRPIAPESARLLREARRAQRKGFNRAAEELALQGYAAKLGEPTIGKAEDRMQMQDLKEKLSSQRLAAGQAEAQQQMAGRRAFAEQIKGMAASNPEEAYGFASQEAPKYGVTPSALASFFERNKLPVKPAWWAPKEDKTKERKPGEFYQA